MKDDRGRTMPTAAEEAQFFEAMKTIGKPRQPTILPKCSKSIKHKMRVESQRDVDESFKSTTGQTITVRLTEYIWKCECGETQTIREVDNPKGPAT